MNDQERKKAVEELKEICTEIGCSGVNPDTCQNSPHLCDIIKKIVFKDGRISEYMYQQGIKDKQMNDKAKAFIAGAEFWKHISTGFSNNWPTPERKRVEEEAIRRYGEPKKCDCNKSQSWGPGKDGFQCNDCEKPLI